MMRMFPLMGLALLLSGCRPAPATLAHGRPVRHWVQTLQDPDVRARQKAVSVLGNVGTADPAVVPALMRAVSDRDVRVRREAVLALLKIGVPAREAIPALEQARKDNDPKVQAYAAKALQRMQDDH